MLHLRATPGELHLLDVVPSDLGSVLQIAQSHWPRQAFRSKQLLQQVLTKASKPVPSEVQTLQGKNFLVSGGLGALGFETCRWLAQKGVKKMHLLGRSLPKDERQGNLQDLRKMSDVEIEFKTCDMMKADQVHDKVCGFPDPLDGIVHSAGKATAVKLLRDLTADDITSALEAGGARGAWNLHTALLQSGRKTQHFVMFSSSASILPTDGQSCYAAERACLDQLAYFRAQKGLPAVSINFGLWTEVGIGSTEFSKRLTPGMKGLSNAEAMKAFEVALCKNHVPCLTCLLIGKTRRSIDLDCMVRSTCK